jgi:hypothetical protein
MKKTTLLLCCLFCFSVFKTTAQDTYSLTVFDEILFYDGYAETVSEPVPDGVIRHSNSLYAKKLTEGQLAQFGNTLTLNVTIKASCDNYDRIGNINLAFVPKNSTSYVPSEVTRLEIGRYITPFMDMNEQPDEVPYTYTIDNVAQILKDETLLAEYDFWVELELFGVPYAANQQIAGCDGRNDVFFGTLEFVSGNNPQITYSNNLVVPLSFKYELRDYTLNGTDELGETVRTVNFTLDQPLPNAKLYLITSSHGANSGGEEYVRRWHYIYVDGTEVLSYRPGGLSCVPFSLYNTQGNCIYTNCNTGVPLADTNSAWSWNNWCPGDKIPIRVVDLGTLAAGEHSFKIDVPAAVFNGDQGMIPMSAYVQGNDQVLAADDFSMAQVTIVPNPVNDIATIVTNNAAVTHYSVLSITGQELLSGSANTIDMGSLSTGVYVVKAQLDNNRSVIRKIVKN